MICFASFVKNRDFSGLTQDLQTFWMFTEMRFLSRYDCDVNRIHLKDCEPYPRQGKHFHGNRCFLSFQHLEL